MQTLLKTLIITMFSLNCINAQCEFKKNEVNESKGGKLVVTYSELMHNKGKAAEWKVVYGGISNFYDGTPQVQLMVCLAGDHFFVSKDDDVVFHFKNGKSITKKNYLKAGAKKSNIGSGETRCATYNIPLDDELKAIFAGDKKECAIEKLEFTHSKGSEEIKLKKKYSNVLGELAKCVMEEMK